MGDCSEHHDPGDRTPQPRAPETRSSAFSRCSDTSPTPTTAPQSPWPGGRHRHKPYRQNHCPPIPMARREAATAGPSTQGTRRQEQPGSRGSWTRPRLAAGQPAGPPGSRPASAATIEERARGSSRGKPQAIQRQTRGRPRGKPRGLPLVCPRFAFGVPWHAGVV